MARPTRFAAPGSTQHVIFRGTNQSAVFVEAADYRFFLDCLEAACSARGCRIHAYVLMTNHVHLLVTPDSKSAIARVLQSVARRYVWRFNDIYQRSGHLWGGRYKATVIQNDRYLFTCSRYIELNPVRAGLAANPYDYPWSSYRANAVGFSDSLLTPHDRYLALGRDPETRRLAYRALFSEALSDSTVTEIRDATNKCWPLGSKRFRDEISGHLARRREPSAGSRQSRALKLESDSSTPTAPTGV